MTDESKALEETAKTTGKAIDFVNRIFGSSLEELGCIVHDKIKFYRWKKCIELVERAQALLQQRALTGELVPIPLRIGIPLLDAASIEEDEKLKEMWAQLIANSADPNTRMDVHPGLIEILKQLTPDEAKFIDHVAHREGYPRYPTIVTASERQQYYGSNWPGLERFESLYSSFSILCSRELMIPEKKRQKTIYDNLIRLRIAEINDKESYEVQYNSRAERSDQEALITISREEKMIFSSLGEQLVKLCIGEPQKS